MAPTSALRNYTVEIACTRHPFWLLCLPRHPRAIRQTTIDSYHIIAILSSLDSHRPATGGRPTQHLYRPAGAARGVVQFEPGERLHLVALRSPLFGARELTGTPSLQWTTQCPIFSRKRTGDRPAADGQRSTLMSEDRPITLEFIAAQLQRVLSEIRILRDDVDVLAATMRRLDNSYDQLVSEMREIREELRAMHAQQQRTVARVRALEDGST